MKTTGIRLFSSIFILVGGSIIFFGLKTLKTASDSTQWPTVAGTVTSSSVISKTGDKGGVTYKAEVLYEYHAGGQTQLSNEVAYGGYGSSNPSNAQNAVNRYPKGKRVTVHYSPNDPTKAVLEPGISTKTFFLPGFGSVFFLAGCAIFYFAPKMNQRQTTPEVPNATTPDPKIG
jgi:hypothetical protein